jgi:ABC-type transport system substrate-binding protein
LEYSPARASRAWLDPKGKDFGPNAKYFQHDPAESKKLLAAAGYPNGFDTTSNYVTTNELPTSKHAEIMEAMIAEVGIKSKVNALDYSSVYVPRFRNGREPFEAGLTSPRPAGDRRRRRASWPTNTGSKVGVTFHGFQHHRQNDMAGDLRSRR